MVFTPKIHQFCLLATCWIGGILSCLLFLQYSLPRCTPQTIPPYQPNVYKSANVSDPITTTTTTTTTSTTTSTTPTTTTTTTTAQPKEEKPILLLWFLPRHFQWDFIDCKTMYNIDSCQLTLDRNLYSQADAVLVLHKAIKWDLSNLPPSPRPPFQKWIWFHVESPTNTPKIPGLENLFNLTMTYRRDSDIFVRHHLTISKKPNENIVIPKKDKLLCWFVSNVNPNTGVGTRMSYYNELKKYINVHVFGLMAGSRLKEDDYYPTMASCKFYLAFENSIHKDYFVEKLNGPLASGTVPVVMGPPRQNYEDFIPGNSFIHVEDFPNAEGLAKYLLQLDKDDEAYKHYFDWRRHLTATPHLIHWYQEFFIYFCHACEYVGRHKEYTAAHNIYKWWFS